MVHCRGRMRLLSSMPSNPGNVLVIPDDDVRRSEGIERASYQLIVPISSGAGVTPQSSRGSPEWLFYEPVIVEVLRRTPVFVSGWSL